MSNLASILNIDPGESGLDVWLFDHARDHELLTAQVQTNTGKTQQFFILGSLFGRNLQDWLLDHQKAHDELSAATGVTGNDLQDVSFEDLRQRDAWIQLNWQEHSAFHAALNI